MMKRTIRRVTSMGYQVAMVLAIGGCQIQAGTPCGDGLCLEGTICATPTNTKLLGTRERCVMPKTCGNGVVESDNPDNNEQCDDGEMNGVGSCRTDCQPNSCGDGRVQPPDEECDDGLMNNGGDKHCRGDCIINRCGDGFVETGREQCEGASPAEMRSRKAVPVETSDCNLDCTKPMCGDGQINRHFMPDGVHTEECDDGANGVRADSARCNADCTFARCGDRKPNSMFKPDGLHPKVCDDGASLNGVPCDYGNPFCVRCNATCTGPVNPGGPFCGDGIPQTSSEGTTLALIEPHETCDPGTGPSTSRPEDLPSREAKDDSADCDKDCTPVVCGDGHHNEAAREKCDDGNQDMCGTCPSTTNTDCRDVTMTPITPAQASATITITDPVTIGNGDTFTLDDGFGKVLTFEFDTGKQINTLAIQIVFVPTPMDSASAIASKMVTTINGQAMHGLGITASVSDAPSDHIIVHLTNQRNSSLGNTEIRFTGQINFVFEGMRGGAAGDCATNVGCVSADDCESGVCSLGTCQLCRTNDDCPASTACDTHGKCH